MLKVEIHCIEVTVSHSRYSQRNSDFDIPTFNTINYGKHSLRYQGPYIWFKLGNKLKDSLNIESFKKNITKIDLTSLLNNSDNCCNLCNSYVCCLILHIFVRYIFFHNCICYVNLLSLFFFSYSVVGPISCKS